MEPGTSNDAPMTNDSGISKMDYVHHFLTTAYKPDYTNVEINGEMYALDKLINDRHHHMLHTPSLFEGGPNPRSPKCINLEQIENAVKKDSRRIRCTGFTSDYPVARRYSEFVPYMNSRKCYIHYQANKMKESTVRLDNFLKRGFPECNVHFKYKYYSWLRLLEFDSELECMKDPDSFMEMVKRVDQYYTKNPAYAISEKIQIGRGPQNPSHMHDKSRLHRYHRGLIKYYSLRVLKEEILNHHGQQVLDKFNADHTTTEISPGDFNCLLKIVNKRIVDGYSSYRNKLQHYRGPQCHEDRWKRVKIEYDEHSIRFDGYEHINLWLIEGGNQKITYK